MNAFDALTERQKDVILRRLGIKNGAPETLQEVANCYGVTRERVRQLEKAATMKLGQVIAHIDNKLEFAKKWQMAGSAGLAAKATGLSYGNACQLSRNLRVAGIPVKKFLKGPPIKVITDYERAAVDPKFNNRVTKRDAFIAMWNDGMGVDQIGKKTGLTIQSVRSKAHQLLLAGHTIRPRGKISKQKVSREDFVRIWQSSETKADVCKATGMNHSAINARRYQLIKLGVPLKSFNKDARFTPSIIDRLKKIARETLRPK
jgi:hypothetical protein